MTGYSHIDRPWLKNYDLSKESSVNVNKTLYENFLTTALSKPNDLAVIDNLTGIKFTFKELLKQVDLFANALSKLGIEKGKKLGMLGFNALIDPIVLLGANKVGATGMFLGPEDGLKDIAKFVLHLDAVVIEGFAADMEPLINPDKKPIVIWGDHEGTLRENCIEYDTFLTYGEGTNAEISNFEKDQSALIIFSSGSTGAPKPIVHSNYTVNCAIEKMALSDFPIDDSNLLIKCIPSHIGLGAITTMLVGLILGVGYIQIKGVPNPVVDLPREVVDLISNYKNWLYENEINNDYGLLLFAAPIFATRLFMEISRVEDLSYVKGILLGGSKMTKQDIEQMQSKFKEKGLSVPLCNGYGQNELAGAAALNTVNHNKNGSAGYPVHNTNVRIVNPDTFEDIKLNELGLILEQSNSQHLCYYEMPEITTKSYVELADGTIWYNTMDLGYMDEDGFIYITGRTNRVVIKDDHKVSLESVEEKIGILDIIDEVAVVPIGQGGDTICYACVNNSILENELFDLLMQDDVGLSLFEKPIKVSILERLPRLDNGKVDFVYLTNLSK